MEKYNTRVRQAISERYVAATKEKCKLSVLKSVIGYIHLLTSPKVQSFPLCLQPQWYYDLC